MPNHAEQIYLAIDIYTELDQLVWWTTRIEFGINADLTRRLLYRFLGTLYILDIWQPQTDLIERIDE